MIKNKIYHWNSVFLFSLFFSIGSVPLQAMECKDTEIKLSKDEPKPQEVVSKQNRGIVTSMAKNLKKVQKDYPMVGLALNFYTRNGFSLLETTAEWGSESVQDGFYGDENNSQLSQKTIDLVRKALEECGILNWKTIPIKRIDKDLMPSGFKIVYPTNKIIFVNEELLNKEFLNGLESKELDSIPLLIIKLDLGHYLNNTYSKLQGTRLLSTSFSIFVTSAVHQKVLPWIKSSINSSSSTGKELISYEHPSFFSFAGMKNLLSSSMSGVGNFALAVGISIASHEFFNRLVKSKVEEKINVFIEEYKSTIIENDIRNINDLCKKISNFLILNRNIKEGQKCLLNNIHTELNIRASKLNQSKEKVTKISAESKNEISPQESKQELDEKAKEISDLLVAGKEDCVEEISRMVSNLDKTTVQKIGDKVKSLIPKENFMAHLLYNAWINGLSISEKAKNGLMINMINIINPLKD
jgi:hypothetical protein